MKKKYVTSKELSSLREVRKVDNNNLHSSSSPMSPTGKQPTTEEERKLWDLIYPSCETYIDCHENPDLENPNAKIQYYCASSCLTYTDECYLESINDPSICEKCEKPDGVNNGYCQPCCRCWEDKDLVDGDRGYTCKDVCDQRNGADNWGDCEIWLGGGMGVSVGLVSVLGLVFGIVVLF